MANEIREFIQVVLEQAPTTQFVNRHKAVRWNVAPANEYRTRLHH